MTEGTPTIFLLSPANSSGIRARQISSPRATFDAALALRSAEGVAIEEAFAFMSALYFRGKRAYAQHFGRPPAGLEHGAWVIAPGFGLVPFGWRVDLAKFKKLGRTEVDPASRSYRRTLERDARQIAEVLGESECRVILLGSIATGKYIDVLWPIFGKRLQFPSCFAGLGDMSRGGLMLRAVRNGEELEYCGLEADRHKKKSPRKSD